MFSQNKPTPGPLCGLCLYIIKSKKQPTANGVLDAPTTFSPAPLNCMRSFLKMEEVDVLAQVAFIQVIVGLCTDVLDPTSFLALLVFPRVIGGCSEGN